MKLEKMDDKKYELYNFETTLHVKNKMWFKFSLYFSFVILMFQFLIKV